MTGDTELAFAALTVTKNGSNSDISVRSQPKFLKVMVANAVYA